MAQNKPDPREMARQAAKLVGTKLDQRKEAERNAANKPQTAAAAAGGAKADPNSMPKGATGTPQKEPPLEDIEHQLAKEYKEYSVAEFFKKNRQMLGYSGKVRSLTTIIHEYVTNSIDSAEDAKILPDIKVEIQEINDHLKVIVEDNGTGIPKSKVGNALGELLSGTKFHQRRQRRGQQGIGAKGATLFAQITTGKPTKVKTSLGNYKIYECEVSIDVKKNSPIITGEKEYSGNYRGTRIEAEFAEVTYNRSEYSVYEYLRMTAIANPHVQVTLIEPTKEIIVFPRASTKIPPKAKDSLPHPLGISTSDLMDMALVSPNRKISSFLQQEFTRVSSDKVKELQTMCPAVDFNRAPGTLQWPEAEQIVQSFQKVKWIAPETDVLIPIGEEQLQKSLKNLLAPEMMRVVVRKPHVFRGGIPFMVEAAIAYGGKAGSEASAAAARGDEKTPGIQRAGEVLRYANSVPLLFDAGSCATMEAVKSIDWARYDLRKWEEMPVSIFINFVSVYVPYTGAGKLAISQEEEIIEEIRSALMECARDISMYLHSLQKAEDQERRRQIFFRYIGEVAEALHDIKGVEKVKVQEKLRKIAEERTKLAEQEEELEEIGVDEDMKEEEEK
ncbi:MAG TPA: DNA topoisomerase VI subunit B [Candidatus Norongarragalinales archaeon]|nr:DNA topoisomerase VI subunit B [Candidatus Norongarragalinales archaeon]